jgi:hypothetical protein
MGCERLGRQRQPFSNDLLHAPELSLAIADAKPQDPRRATLGEESQAVERQVEGMRVERTAKRSHDAFFEGSVGGSEKLQRQVHAILPAPTTPWCASRSRHRAIAK